ncbi:hypothetical protein [Noviherbaspirillum pedocola]|uniref:Uncharacterized protein n=1 Tax=Noviherbaspirillum pedocola TaxID=2801341 RepID=A0A934SSV6_9BURK|nr:hypothetical protein [Noviherbaspirillum pedocola]MBK4736156.1 hypothetical protein [Noviherbaspirillum pedocola]
MADDIKKMVELAQESAGKHAQHCIGLLTEGRLAEAIEYCSAQGIEPPKCSLTAQSPNAHRLREIAKGMLSDEAWWKKRLKVTALRNYENTAIREGRVTQGISDEMFAYMKSEKR